MNLDIKPHCFKVTTRLTFRIRHVFMAILTHAKFHFNRLMVKSVQSALSDLKRHPEGFSPSAIIGLSLLNSILMARFLKQSFAQNRLKETVNGKLQQFNYSRSLMTNRERSRQELAALQRIIMHHLVEKRKSFVFARQYIIR